jgi:sulfite reductase (NADPH) flavoprotein alpha-component
MDLVRKDAAFFMDLLAQGGYIMICGALKCNMIWKIF